MVSSKYSFAAPLVLTRITLLFDCGHLEGIHLALCVDITLECLVVHFNPIASGFY